MSSPPVVSALRGRRILPFRLAVSSSVWRSVLAVAADRPTSSRWLRNRGAHSSESAVIVNRNVFEALPKTPSRTTTSTTFHRLKPCGSPAADAYFTVFPGALQALPVKKFQPPPRAVHSGRPVDDLRARRGGWPGPAGRESSGRRFHPVGRGRSRRCASWSSRRCTPSPGRRAPPGLRHSAQVS